MYCGIPVALGAEPAFNKLTCGGNARLEGRQSTQCQRARVVRIIRETAPDRARVRSFDVLPTLDNCGSAPTE
jgi:hypothetical protein